MDPIDVICRRMAYSRTDIPRLAFIATNPFVGLNDDDNKEPNFVIRTHATLRAGGGLNPVIRRLANWALPTKVLITRSKSAMRMYRLAIG